MIKQLEIVPNHNYTLNPPLEEINLWGVSAIDMDLETNGLIPWKSVIRIIALKIGSDKYLIQPEYYETSELVKFFEGINTNKIKVRGHNIKFDANFIMYHYNVLLNDMSCTMLMSQLVQGGSRLFNNALDNCLEYYLGIVQEKGKKKEMQKSFLGKGALTAEQFNYALGDIDYLEALEVELYKRLEDMGLTKVYLLEQKLLRTLVKMETTGCLIDLRSWKKKLGEWENKKKELLTLLDAEYMKLYPYSLFANLNYSSPKQVIDFFKKLGLPAPLKEDRKGKDVVSRESVDEGALDNYLNEYPDTPVTHFVTLLKQYREYDKLISTYGDSFLERLDESDHIHTTYTQCTTATGRLSSKNPNLQNIPSDKSGEGGVVREYFIAPPGHKIITCDMASAEIVLAADFSGEPLLVKSIEEGVDMHSELATISASIIYGRYVRISKSTEPLVLDKATIIPQEFRDIHKSVTFSKFYKGGPKRVYDILSRYINPVHPAKRRTMIAKRISEAIDRALPKLSSYLTQQIDQANSQGWLTITKLGRRRKFDTKVHGEAANAKIQGSNGEAMKIAMVNTDRYLETIGGWMVLSVHDEIAAVVCDEYADDAAKEIQRIMADALTWQLSKLKGSASAKVKPYWEK